MAYGPVRKESAVSEGQSGGNERYPPSLDRLQHTAKTLVFNGSPISGEKEPIAAPQGTYFVGSRYRQANCRTAFLQHNRTFQIPRQSLERCEARPSLSGLPGVTVTDRNIIQRSSKGTNIT